MKIAFVIPSRAFLASAGARIRYLRLAPLLQGAGHEVDLVPIDEFGVEHRAGDTVIFSKCFDGRALAAAICARVAGCRVGLDLFDDYFSQAADSRMTMYRTWLDQMLAQADFALCSTVRMAEIVDDRAPGFPVHVFNDPAADLRVERLPALLDAKAARLRTERHMRLCWFGIGDNPFFPVGLDDLLAYAPRLACLNERGWTAELTVSTNLRALDALRLEGLARLPLPVTVELWSEAREAELLLESDCCFLPVNAQPFSTAKSLNRAVSALSAGCQLIWAGFPLYAALDPLIYADARDLLDDLERGALRHGGARLDCYRRLMGDLASLDVEAERLLVFLETLAPRPFEAAPARLKALVHGVQTNGHAHKLARRRGVLSVGTPFSPPTLVYDVLFTGHPADGGLRMLVAEAAVDLLLPHCRAGLRAFGQLNKTAYHALDWPDGSPLALHNFSERPLPEQLAAYSGIYPRVHARLEQAFGPVETSICEFSKLPFDPTAGAPAR